MSSMTTHHIPDKNTARVKRKSFGSLWKKYRLYYFLMLIGLVYFLIYKYVPMAGIFIAFKDVSPIMNVEEMFAAPWVGFKHFSAFFNSIFFWNILRNTVVISLYNLLFGFPAPIIFALLINEVRHRKYQRVLQSISYLPHFLSIVIVVGMVRNIFSPNGGLVNQIYMLFGGSEPIFFLGSNDYIRSLIVGSSIWQEIGWGSIIYLAAITGVDQELYEAATIDGANRFQRMWYITLPGIMFTISIMFIMQCGRILDAGFERVLLLYNPITYQNADIIDTYVYRTGLADMRYSFSTAVGLFKSIFSLVLVTIVNWGTKKMGQEGLW